jgi:hypothetical protein
MHFNIGHLPATAHTLTLTRSLTGARLVAPASLHLCQIFESMISLPRAPAFVKALLTLSEVNVRRCPECCSSAMMLKQSC